MMDFFIIFFLLTIFGALVINGWFLASRGEIEIQPDGTEKKIGAIFKAWQIFWEQKYGVPELIQYKGKQLYDLKREIIQTAKQEGYAGTFLFMDEFILSTNDIKPYIPQIEYQIKDLKIHCYRNEPEVIHDKSSASCRLTLFKKEDVYLFPEWIRTMIASCITCHASVYGSLIFWTYILLFGRFVDTDIQLVATWMAYVLSLAFLNTFFYKQLNKH